MKGAYQLTFLDGFLGSCRCKQTSSLFISTVNFESFQGANSDLESFIGIRKGEGWFLATIKCLTFLNCKPHFLQIKCKKSPAITASKLHCRRWTFNYIDQDRLIKIFLREKLKYKKSGIKHKIWCSANPLELWELSKYSLGISPVKPSEITFSARCFLSAKIKCN